MQFWVHLSEQLQSSEDTFVASKEGVHMLKIITDQLVSLSRYIRYRVILQGSYLFLFVSASSFPILSFS